MALHFVLYEIAGNSEIQETLRNEIIDINDDENVTFETIQGMKYLEAVVNGKNQSINDHCFLI